MYFNNKIQNHAFTGIINFSMLGIPLSLGIATTNRDELCNYIFNPQNETLDEEYHHSCLSPKVYGLIVLFTSIGLGALCGTVYGVAYEALKIKTT